MHEIHGPPVTVPSRGTQELEWLDVRSAHHLALWQTLCCPFTTRAPHKSQQYLFIVFLPLYSTAEQMILNKGLLSPPQAQQASLSKDKIGETLQKWQVQQIKIKQ